MRWLGKGDVGIAYGYDCGTFANGSLGDELGRTDVSNGWESCPGDLVLPISPGIRGLLQCPNLPDARMGGYDLVEDRFGLWNDDEVTHCERCLRSLPGDGSGTTHFC